MSLDDRLAIAEDIISPFQLHGRIATAAIREARSLLRANLTPGFICEGCGVFTGLAKEEHTKCRACGKERT